MDTGKPSPLRPQVQAHEPAGVIAAVEPPPAQHGHRAAGETEPADGPLSLIALQGRSNRIPHHGQRVRSRSLLDGKTVFESLVFAASVCFTVTAYFQNLDKLDTSDNLERLDLKIRSQLDVLERIADAVVFQELQSLIVKSLR